MALEEKVRKGTGILAGIVLLASAAGVHTLLVTRKREKTVVSYTDVKSPERIEYQLQFSDGSTGSATRYFGEKTIRKGDKLFMNGYRRETH